MPSSGRAVAAGPSPAGSGRPIRGVIPVLVTSFREDDALDLDELEREIEFLCSGPCQWASIGFGSEIARLDPGELDELMRRAVSFSAGRIGVIGNAEVAGVQPGLAALERAASSGADVAMVRPSALEGVDQRGVLETFETIARRSPLPLVVQDAPQTTAVELAPATIARLLLGEGSIVAAKIEPPSSTEKISLVVEALGPDEAVILGGLGGRLYLQELERGACGTMPGPAFPEVLAVAERRFLAGDRVGAHALAAQLLPLANLSARDMDAFRFVQKHILVRRGVLRSDRLRAPHAPIDASFVREVDELIEALGLLDLIEACARELKAP